MPYFVCMGLTKENLQNVMVIILFLWSSYAVVFGISYTEASTEDSRISIIS